VIDRALEVLRETYPSVNTEGLSAKNLSHLVSPVAISIPSSLKDRAERAISDLFKFSRSESQLAQLRKTLGPADLEVLEKGPNNLSVLMAYDFHYDTQLNQLSLIEINTNASGYLFADIAYRVHSMTETKDPRKLLLKSFIEEAAAFGKSLSKVHIIDENPETQRMYPEFLLYQDWFRQNGVECEIFDFSDQKALESCELIYNRYCDFNLSEGRSAHLRAGYLNKTVTFSPNPREYLLLADKARLLEFAMAQVSDVIIPMREFSSFSDPDELWAQRKKYYFKPKRLFGGKAVFRGASISRTRFNEIFSSDYVAQETRPPAEHDGWRYDLRFFVYKDQVQMVAARLFKGQLMNFSEVGGGFAPVNWN
jgi:hypothetical protein